MASLERLGFVYEDGYFRINRATKVEGDITGRATYPVYNNPEVIELQRTKLKGTPINQGTMEGVATKKHEAEADQDPTRLAVEATKIYLVYVKKSVRKALNTQDPTLRAVNIMNADAVLKEAMAVTPGGIRKMHKLHIIREKIINLK